MGIREYKKEWWQRRRARETPADVVHRHDVERKRRYMRDFGITVEEYDQLLKKQNGVCALPTCKFKLGKRRLAVDHCHETGRVRGLLCSRCNAALAVLGDNEAGITQALEYIRCRQ